MARYSTARSSFRNCIGSNRLLFPAVFTDSGEPGRALDFSLVVFDDGAVFHSSLVVSKSYRFDEVPFARGLRK